ncbi:MAG: hypothetical protein V3V14_04230 [Saprospiraceae bacterium]
MKNLFVFLLFGIFLLSCSEESNQMTLSDVVETESQNLSSRCDEMGVDWIRNDVDSFIYFSVSISQNILSLDSNQMTIELETFFNYDTTQIVNLVDYSNHIAQVLQVDNNLVLDYLEFYQRNPQITTESNLENIVNPRFFQLLRDEIICVEELDIHSSLSTTRICTGWQMGAGLLTGATTLISCGACASGILISCWGCATGVAGTIESNSCWFD